MRVIGAGSVPRARVPAAASPLPQPPSRPSPPMLRPCRTLQLYRTSRVCRTLWLHPGSRLSRASRLYRTSRLYPTSRLYRTSRLYPTSRLCRTLSLLQASWLHPSRLHRDIGAAIDAVGWPPSPRSCRCPCWRSSCGARSCLRVALRAPSGCPRCSLVVRRARARTCRHRDRSGQRNHDRSIGRTEPEPGSTDPDRRRVPVRERTAAEELEPEPTDRCQADAKAERSLRRRDSEPKRRCVIDRVRASLSFADPQLDRHASESHADAGSGPHAIGLADSLSVPLADTIPFADSLTHAHLRDGAGSRRADSDRCPGRLDLGWVHWNVQPVGWSQQQDRRNPEPIGRCLPGGDDERVGDLLLAHRPNIGRRACANASPGTDATAPVSLRCRRHPGGPEWLAVRPAGRVHARDRPLG